MASYRDGEPVVMRSETGISFGFYRGGPFVHADGRAFHLIEPSWFGRNQQPGYRVPLVEGEFERLDKLRFYADTTGGRVCEVTRHGDELASVVVAESPKHGPQIAALLQAEHERTLPPPAAGDVWDIGRPA